MTHLHDVHNIKRRSSEVGGDFGLYLKEHFPVPKCCCGCGKEVNLHTREFAYARFAKDCINKNRFRNPSCIEFYLDQDMSVDDAIIALSSRQMNVAKRHSTRELRELLVKCNSGQQNPSSYKSIKCRTGKTYHEIQKEISERSSGKNNGFYNRSHLPEVKKKAARQSAINRSKQARTVTKPELVIWAWLQASGIEFLYEVAIDTVCVDYLIGDAVIEVYGDYWHSDRMTSKGILIDTSKRDIAKTSLLKSLGYEVHVFWESEIMKTPKIAFQRFTKIINEIKIDKTNA